MAVEIAHDTDKQVAVMFCNTSDSAFGPIFTGPTADSDAEEFLRWLADGIPSGSIDNADSRIIGDGTDPRDYPADRLEELVMEWREVTENARQA